MQFIRKQFLLILCILLVYGAYVVTHVHTATKQQVLGASVNLSLFVQPESGEQPILDAINASQKEVDVEVYLLSDKDIIASLIAACGRGVTVRVMLEEHPFGGGTINQKTHQQLNSSCVHVAWTNPTFSLTHEKTIVIDSQEVFILNQNLTASSFTKNREYDIIDTNRVDIATIQQLFQADWTRNSFRIGSSNLVISPLNSRDTLTSLVSSATTTLSIETEVIDDPDMIRLLMQKAKSIPVAIILPSFSSVSSNKKVAQEFIASGIQVKTITSPYIHAKLILVDNRRAYVGSVNLTTQSMDDNREVGIILSQQDILAPLRQTFSRDWENATSL